MNSLTHLEVKAIQDGGIIESAGLRIQFWSFIFTTVVIITSIVSTISIKNSFGEWERRKSNA